MKRVKKKDEEWLEKGVDKSYTDYTSCRGYILE